MSGQVAIAPRHPFDRRFFAANMAMIWAAIIVGFGIDIPRRLATKNFDYPLIVHVHAAVFVGWLALFTAQMLLVRAGNVALHKRLGRLAVALVPPTWPAAPARKPAPCANPPVPPAA